MDTRPRSDVMSSPRSLRSILSIVIQSRSCTIRKVARNLAIRAILRVIHSGFSFVVDQRSENDLGDDPNECLLHEASLWVDGVTSESAPTLCRLITMVKSAGAAARHNLLVCEAKELALPTPSVTTKEIIEANDTFPFSPLLSESLAWLAVKNNEGEDKETDGGAASLPVSFSRLVLSMTGKVMLRLKDPIPLAALVDLTLSRYDSSVDQDSMTGTPAWVDDAIALRRYARSLINDASDKVATMAVSSAEEMTLRLFGKNNFHSILAKGVVIGNGSVELSTLLGERIYNELGITAAVLRQCLNRKDTLTLSNQYDTASDASLRALIGLLLDVSLSFIFYYSHENKFTSCDVNRI